jgi:hypothetical protein
MRFVLSNQETLMYRSFQGTDRRIKEYDYESPEVLQYGLTSKGS